MTMIDENRHTEIPDTVASDQVAWTHGLSHAARRRLAMSAAQAVGIAVAGAISIPAAFLMLTGWPASLGQVRQSALDIVGVAHGLIRLLVAPEFAAFLPVTLLAPLLALFVFEWFGLFSRPGAGDAPFSESVTLAKGSAVIALLLVLTGVAFGTVTQAEMTYLHSSLFFVYIALILFFFTMLYRSGLLILYGAIQSLGWGQTRVAVIASDDSNGGLHFAPGSGYRLAGTISTNEEGAYGNAIGSLSDLEVCINEHGLHEVVLAIDQSELTSSQRHELAHTCWKLGVDLKMVAPFHPYFRTTNHSDTIAGIPLLDVERSGLYGNQAQTIKRAMDVAVSFAGLTALSPLLLLVALAIRLESKGPVLFVQKRPGLHGRVFNIIKFRSMYLDADHTLHQEAQRQLIRHGTAAEIDESGKAIYGKVARDPRITRVGRFIRRTSIDELPQLINVFRGDMSLVGPRPSVLYELENYSERHMRRLGIRPGITGLWQVSGRSRLSFDQMVDLDLQYLEEWSLALDLKIILKTLPAVLDTDSAI